MEALAWALVPCSAGGVAAGLSLGVVVAVPALPLIEPALLGVAGVAELCPLMSGVALGLEGVVLCVPVADGSWLVIVPEVVLAGDAVVL